MRGRPALSPGIGLWGIHADAGDNGADVLSPYGIVPIAQDIGEKRSYHDLHTQRKGAAAEKKLRCGNELADALSRPRIYLSIALVFAALLMLFAFRI
jgi:hypothetical protein